MDQYSNENLAHLAEADCRLFARSRGGEVAPSAAPTGRPMALAGCHHHAPPLDRASDIGNPEALGAGEREGAEPSRQGGGEAAAPNLDTPEITHPLTPSRRLPFRPVRRSCARYRVEVADELRRLGQTYFPKGKNRRSWRHKAFDLESCGQTVRMRQCTGCGSLEPKSALIECACSLRVCPTCARHRANNFRRRISNLWQALPRPPWAALYFITFTLKYDPASADDLSVDGLRGRKEIVLAAVRYCWRRYLKARGVAMAISVEVSPRGAVHVHALYCGRRPDINTLRDTYMIRAGESKMVNIKYVRHPHKAICEIAKYIAKAASPKSAALFRGALGEFTDPVLAARIEVAFAGTRLLQCYGAWRGADDESDLPDDTPTPCPLCGVPDHLRPVRLTLADWLKRAPSDWAPRLAREGPAIREFYARHPELKRRRNDNEQR